MNTSISGMKRTDWCGELTITDAGREVCVNGWCDRTRDCSLCSHYEHTIAITEDGLPEILTLPGFVWKEEE